MDEPKIYYPDTIEDQPLTSIAVEDVVTTGSTANKTASTGNVVESLSTIPARPIPIPVMAKELISDSLNTQSRQILSSYTFGKVGALQIGEYVSGTSGDIRISPDGITGRNSAGVTTFSIDGTTGNATFKGTIVAGSVISAEISANLITGTIVNAQIASIEWAKITNVAITNADIVSLSASKITTGTLSGISISIGSGDNVFKADSNGIYLGDSTYSDAPFRVNMDGDVFASSITLENALISTNSTYQGNVIDATYIGSLTAGHITSGTLSVGGTSQVAGIVFSNSDRNSTGKLRWVLGSKIWEDNSGRVGINSNGDSIYIYVENNEKIVIPSAGLQVVIRGGISCRDGGLNVGSSSSDRQNARVTGTVYLRAGDESGSNTQYINSTNNDIRHYTDDNHEFYRQGSLKAIIDQNIFTEGDLLANGSKPFLIPHPDGSNRLLKYTAQESPDVSLRYRGVIKMEKDIEDIVVPDHFKLVTEPKGLVTVNIVPVIENKNDVVPSIAIIGYPSNAGFKLKGKKGLSIMFEIIAIRLGYLNAEIEIDLNNVKNEEIKKYSVIDRRIRSEKQRWDKKN